MCRRSSEVVVEYAIGARRIRSISKHGMLSLTNLMDVFFRKLSYLSSPVTGLLKSESFLKKTSMKVVNEHIYWLMRMGQMGTFITTPLPLAKNGSRKYYWQFLISGLLIGFWPKFQSRVTSSNWKQSSSFLNAHQEPARLPRFRPSTEK